MKYAGCWLVIALMAAGCAGTHTRGNTPVDKPRVIVSPDTTLVGRVVRVNSSSRFAVLNFPVGNSPVPGTMFSAFRRGLKVADVKVTTWQRDENCVADIVVGEVQVGDEVRSN